MLGEEPKGREQDQAPGRRLSVGWRASGLLAALCLTLACGCQRMADREQEEALLGPLNGEEPRAVKVQLILMYSGFGPAELDGMMGPDTRTALKGFQKSRGLPATGYLGKRTWAEMTRVERSEGPFTVTRMQWGLRVAGFDPGSIDGQAGRMTMVALSQFQHARSLTSTGKLDPQTWAALRGFMPGSASEPR